MQTPLHTTCQHHSIPLTLSRLHHEKDCWANGTGLLVQKPRRQKSAFNSVRQSLLKSRAFSSILIVIPIVLRSSTQSCFLASIWLEVSSLTQRLPPNGGTIEAAKALENTWPLLPFTFCKYSLWLFSLLRT